MLRQGIMPTNENTFDDYLGNYDWNQESIGDYQRGDFTSQFNPRTRQIYF